MHGAGYELAVVQFCDPRGEHNPGAADTMPWNTGDHCRKFLRSHGRYLDRDGVLCSGIVTFWGEWEAQSRVVERYQGADAEMPRFVHEPFLQRPGDVQARRQNTDPFAFGDTFLYGNWRQFTSVFNPSCMQRLAPGSIILFGSKLNHRFVLDTLMVIGSATPYVIGEPESGGDDVPSVFRAAVLEPLAASRRLAGTKAVLYRGRMHGPRQQDMFSFVPACAEGRPFARPAIRVAELVNPTFGRSPRRPPYR